MRGRWPGILIRVLLFLAIGSAAFIFQADRWARKNPAISSLVPEGLGGFADLNRLAALETASPGSGLALAKVVVAERPVPATPLRLLSNAAIERDDVELAGRALTLAGQRGWRDTFTQVAVMSSAIAAEQWDVAAQRADAMARTARDRRLVERGLAFLVSEPEGRTAVAVRLTEGAPLGHALIGLVRNDEAQLQPVVDTFVMANVADTGMSCASFANLTNFLLTKGHGAEAVRVWPERCRSAGATDLKFDLNSQSDDPLAWQFPSAAGLSLSQGAEAGTLDIRNRNVLTREFARRYLTLRGGSYRLTIERNLTVDRPVNPSNVQVKLTCDRSQTLLDDTVDAVQIIKIPDGCSTQMLSLAASRGRARSVKVLIDAN